MKISIELSQEELKNLKVFLSKNEENERKDLEEYVFIPILNDITYKYDGQTLTLSKDNDDIVKISIPSNPNHITRIMYNNYGMIDIRNVTVISQYAVDKDTLGLVQTLDPCDHVKGIIINGEVTSLREPLSLQQIVFSKDEIMDKLYLLRKANGIEFKKNIRINLIISPKIVSKSVYDRLRRDELLKERLQGIFNLYGIKDEKSINNLLERMTDIIWYHNI